MLNWGLSMINNRNVGERGYLHILPDEVLWGISSAWSWASEPWPRRRSWSWCRTGTRGHQGGPLLNQGTLLRGPEKSKIWKNRVQSVALSPSRYASWRRTTHTVWPSLISSDLLPSVTGPWMRNNVIAYPIINLNLKVLLIVSLKFVSF